MHGERLDLDRGRSQIVIVDDDTALLENCPIDACEAQSIVNSAEISCLKILDKTAFRGKIGTKLVLYISPGGGT